MPANGFARRFACGTPAARSQTLHKSMSRDSPTASWSGPFPDGMRAVAVARVCAKGWSARPASGTTPSKAPRVEDARRAPQWLLPDIHRFTQGAPQPLERFPPSDVPAPEPPKPVHTWPHTHLPPPMKRACAHQEQSEAKGQKCRRRAHVPNMFGPQVHPPGTPKLTLGFTSLSHSWRYTRSLLHVA